MASNPKTRSTLPGLLSVQAYGLTLFLWVYALLGFSTTRYNFVVPPVVALIIGVVTLGIGIFLTSRHRKHLKEQSQP